ncbi:MAG TPA: zinc ribbon domain-containing protein [Candidatus Binataceae bacterium]|nr:zinc ribbon domain-containing protein [Candidatus Binataceae bacterium]
MPLYECRCEPCGVTFEVLVPLSAARMRSRPCPQCARPARRIISAVSFMMGGGSPPPGAGRSDPSRRDVTSLKVPPSARLCWMDDKSASRFAAYKHGRGAEYDDTVAARAERSAQLGLPETKNQQHPHGHDHSPLADPAVYARRRAAAARKLKAAESKEITSRPRPPA